MGDLHDAVAALLDAFARGISVIRAQRARRKEQQQPVETVQKTAETHLRKSLKKNRAEVREAYGRDLARYGSRFASGDAEAQSALSSILFRLNAAFVSVIERFTKGRSTRADYLTLMNMSNASRLEAIQTFDQLSKRLSQSSLALPPSSKHPEKPTHSNPKKKARHPPSSRGVNHSRSKSAPSLLITPSDHPGPKPVHRKSSGSKTSTSSKEVRAATERHHSIISRKPTDPHARATPPPPRSPHPRSRSDRRSTAMSAKSDSTKLGEIPEHKWARNEGGLPVVYPLDSYPAPEKQRFRFMRFFGK